MPTTNQKLSALQQLAKRRLHAAQQPRDENGRWSKLGGWFGRKPADSDPPPQLPEDGSSFKTTRDAQNWAKQQYPHIDWAIDKFDPAVATGVVQQFHQLAQEYPAVAQRMKHFGDPRQFRDREARQAFQDVFNKKNTCFAFASDDGTVLGLNPNLCADRAKLNEKIARGVGQGWLINGGDNNPAGYLVSHEFGHHVWNYLTMEWPDLDREKVPLTEFDREMQERIKTLFQPNRKSLFGDTEELVRTWIDHNKATQELSAYGTTTMFEGWAEGFASLHHTPRDRQTSYAKSLSKLLAFVKQSPPDTETEFLERLKDMNIPEWEF